MSIMTLPALADIPHKGSGLTVHATEPHLVRILPAFDQRDQHLAVVILGHHDRLDVIGGEKLLVELIEATVQCTLPPHDIAFRDMTTMTLEVAQAACATPT
jgi:hypothetical protein